MLNATHIHTQTPNEMTTRLLENAKVHAKNDIARCMFSGLKMRLNSPASICEIKIFFGGYTPDPQESAGKGRGGEGRTGKRKGVEGGEGWDGEGRAREREGRRGQGNGRNGN
jgi:hypothetical protein